MQDNYLYIHKDITITDAKELVEGNNIFSLVKTWNLRGLLDYEIYNKKNITRIYETLLESLQNSEFRKNSPAQNLLTTNYLKDLEKLEDKQFIGPFNTTSLVKGTKLYFPRIFWNHEVMISESNFVETKDYEDFLTVELKKLLNDAKYFPVSKMDIGNNFGKIQELSPKITVWAWVRSLNKVPHTDIESNNELPGQIINLTPYIRKIQTFSGAGGGNFTINLAPISGYWDNDNGWQIDKDSILRYNQNNELNIFAHSNIEQKVFDKNEQSITNKENLFYFEQIMQENDFIWIRYESLNNELPYRLRDSSKEEIFSDDIPGKIYDIMGLVDNCNNIKNYEGVSVDINISGRDLIKIVIEDGCYFYPTQFINEGIFANDTKSNYLQRVEGQLASLTQASQKTIENTLKFIFNALSNSEIVPDYLFSQYPDADKTKRFEFNENFYKVHKTNYLEDNRDEKNIKIILQKKYNLPNSDVDYIYKIIYNFVNTAYKKKKITTAGIFTKDYENIEDNPYQNITGWKNFDYFEGLIAIFVRNGETPEYFINQGISFYEDPTIDISSSEEEDYGLEGGVQNYINLIYRLIRKKEEKIPKNESNLINQKDFVDAKGIWKIIKLSIDDDVRNRMLVDNTIGNEMGSILNYIQKVCQEPFVQFDCDTYGDKFVFYVRKPPFDKKKIQEYVKTYIDNIDALRISSEDVSGTQLVNTTGMAYSWYRIIPQGALSGMGGNDITFAYIKALHFPEYAKIWGEKPLEIYSNYISNYFPAGGKENLYMSNVLRSVIEDLKYLVESNAYLPFTRNGTITLKGDRRIKKGIWILYKPTNEIFYVDSVTNIAEFNDGQIVRKTILNVSRGMVYDFVKGKEIDGKLYSYFNIIDTDYKFEYKEIENTTIQKEEVPIIDNNKVSITPIKTSNSVLIGKCITKQVMRYHDSHGFGFFGAVRNREKNGIKYKGTHQGVDIISIPNENVFAPIDGVIRVALPGHHNLPGISILGKNQYDGYEIKIFYCSSIIPEGTSVKKGDIIARASNMAVLYSQGMTNHLHFEKHFRGKLENPTNDLFRDFSNDDKIINNKIYCRNLSISNEGRNYIKEQELFHEFIYQKENDYYIGYGHLLNSQESIDTYNKLKSFNKPITEIEAEGLFENDLKIKGEDKVKSIFGNILMMQNQYDALVDFGYTSDNFDNYPLFIIKIKDYLNSPTLVKEKDIRNFWKDQSVQDSKLFISTDLISRRVKEIELFFEGITEYYNNEEKQKTFIKTTTKKTKEIQTNAGNILSSFKVNKNVFNFFLRKQDKSFRY
jgi:murein DD-endopeptidase MepM/ murein hydrolase activator NlpD